MERKDGQKRRRAGMMADEMLIAAFIRGATWRGAAKYANVSPKAIQVKIHDPRFLKKLAEARRQLISRTIDKVNSSAIKAIGALVKLLDNPDADVTLRAAQTLLESCTKFAAISALEQRLAELENVQKNRGRTVIDQGE